MELTLGIREIMTLSFPQPRRTPAFTLIELLVVITIIAILMGLLFPAFRGIQDQARKTQAKNDLTQIITAVRAYYTEYGRYPLAPSWEQGHDVTFDVNNLQDQLLNVLRANGSGRDDPNTGGDNNENPRRIPFLAVNYAKDTTNPRGGISQDIAPHPGMFMDPWGNPYIIRIDGNYDHSLKNPYATNAGSDTLNEDVLVWSMGSDGKSDSNTTHLDPPSGSGDRKVSPNDDDVLSWQ